MSMRRPTKKNNPLFVLAIVSFFMLMCLHFISGVVIFVSRYGWRLSSLNKLYRGPDGTVFPLSHHLEVAIPHSLAIGLSVFALTHFFLFTHKQYRPWLYSLWFFTFANTFCAVFIYFLGESFLGLKWLTFLGFQLSFAGVIGVFVRDFSQQKSA